jgi:hypothetical protein
LSKAPPPVTEPSAPSRTWRVRSSTTGIRSPHFISNLEGSQHRNQIARTPAALPWRRPRFTVRTVLAATALVAVLLGILSLASHTPEVEWNNGELVTE